MDLKQLARSILSGSRNIVGGLSNEFIYNPDSKQIFPHSPVLNYARAKTEGDKQKAVMDTVIGMTGTIKPIAKLDRITDFNDALNIAKNMEINKLDDVIAANDRIAKHIKEQLTAAEISKLRGKTDKMIDLVIKRLEAYR